MRRTVLKKIGTVGKANIEARNRIAVIAEEKGLNYCELALPSCLGQMYLAPAHRHKRAWYKGNVELLSDYRQWISACVSCHAVIENDPELTELKFAKLRP